MQQHLLYFKAQTVSLALLTSSTSFFSWGKEQLLLIQVTCRLLASIITGQFLSKLCNIVTFLFLINHMTYLLFFIKILY
jgi:hypothetical protein